MTVSWEGYFLSKARSACRNWRRCSGLEASAEYRAGERIFGMMIRWMVEGGAAEICDIKWPRKAEKGDLVVSWSTKSKFGRV